MKRRRRSSASSDHEGSVSDSGKAQQDAPSLILQDILKSKQSRFLNEHSAFAFPRVLGINLQTTDAPRIHAFGNHVGLGVEDPCTVKTSLADHVTLDQARSVLKSSELACSRYVTFSRRLS